MSSTISITTRWSACPSTFNGDDELMVVVPAKLDSGGFL